MTNRILRFTALTALALLALLILNRLVVPSAPDTPSCYLVAPDADHAFGPITNAQFDGLRWRNDRGEVIGYAQHEDANIYSTPADAIACAPYLEG